MSDKIKSWDQLSDAERLEVYTSRLAEPPFTNTCGDVRVVGITQDDENVSNPDHSDVVAYDVEVWMPVPSSWKTIPPGTQWWSTVCGPIMQRHEAERIASVLRNKKWSKRTYEKMKDEIREFDVAITERR